MSYWSSRFNTLWHRTQKIGSDSLVLASKLAKSPASSRRDILLCQARAANAAASSYLRVEREIGLLQYHGFWGYLRERSILPISALSSNGIGFGAAQPTEEKTQATSRSQSTTARVAFMITAAQRATLSEDFGYTVEQIKLLKPIEASLILEHEVQPNEMESSLPRLVQDYHISLAAAQISTEKKISQEPLVVKFPSHVEPKDPQFATDDVEETQEPMLSLPTGISNTTEPNSRLWYEVVQVKPDSVDTIGLYPNESEAKLCLDTKEHIRAKHAPDEEVRFELRTTRK